jgi:hypothetical protein
LFPDLGNNKSHPLQVLDNIVPENKKTTSVKAKIVTVLMFYRLMTIFKRYLSIAFNVLGTIPG